jgi:hypothetical protein
MAVRAESEAAFQVAVINFAVYNGWRYYHPPANVIVHLANGRTKRQETVPGYPDLTLIHRRMRRIEWVELKAQKGRVRTEQKDWLADLEIVAATINDAVDDARTAMPAPYATIGVRLWRPSDWDEIRAVLARSPEALRS